MLRAGRHERARLLPDDRRGLAEVRDAPRTQRDAARRAVVRGLDQAVQAVGELRQPRGQLLREGASGPGWRWTSSCAWRPAGGAACPRCSAGSGTASARAGGRSTEADVRDAAAAIGRAARMDRFFDRYVRGTDELPLPALLAARRAEGGRARRMGRERPSAPGRSRPRARAAGARLDRRSRCIPTALLVRNVVPDSPAWRAGLTFGDEIVAVDGARVNPATFAKRVGDAARARACRIAYFRRDLLREATLTLAESPERTWSVAADAQAPARARGRARPAGSAAAGDDPRGRAPRVARSPSRSSRWRRWPPARRRRRSARPAARGPGRDRRRALAPRASPACARTSATPGGR